MCHIIEYWYECGHRTDSSLIACPLPKPCQCSHLNCPFAARVSQHAHVLCPTCAIRPYPIYNIAAWEGPMEGVEYDRWTIPLIVLHQPAPAPAPAPNPWSFLPQATTAMAPILPGLAPPAQGAPAPQTIDQTSTASAAPHGTMSMAQPLQGLPPPVRTAPAPEDDFVEDL